MALFISSLACGMGVRRSPASFEHAVSRFGNWIRNADGCLGLISDTASVAAATCGVLSNAMSMAKLDFSDSPHDRRINTVNSMLSVTNGGIGAVRAVGLWSRFLSGQMFWETGHNGEFLYKPRETLTGDANKKIWRCPIDIASDVSLMVARTCSAASFLHNHQLVDLGKHAQIIGGGPLSVACFGFAVSDAFSAASGAVAVHKGLKNYNSDSLESRKEMRSLIFGFLCDVIDIVATFVDYGLIILGGPIGMLIGSVLILFSSVLNLVRRCLG
ncbi:MAG: hypothetical protein RSB82_00605 [Victivallaceae bacterium]